MGSKSIRMMSVATSGLVVGTVGILLGATGAGCRDANEPDTETVRSAVADPNCQRISDEFGVTANVTWGIAPSEIQKWWTANSCMTSPQTSTDLCQKISDIFGAESDVTWAYTPGEVQNWWKAHSCASKPLVSESACQRAADIYGIVPSVGFGTAPAYVRTWWTTNNCNTPAHGTSACQKAADLYGMKAGVTWGFAPNDVRTWWFNNNCNANTTTSVAQLCKNAATMFAIKPSVNFGGAPAEVQQWWTANHCNVAPTCQSLSEMFGVRANVNFGYAGAPASPVPTYIQDWWTANACATTGLFTIDTCQRASDLFDIKAGVTFAFAPSFVQTWWTGKSCQASPKNQPIFIPSTEVAAPPAMPPVAPTQLVVTRTDAVSMYFQYKDNNPAANVGFIYDLWEVLPDGRTFDRGQGSAGGPIGGTETGSIPLTYLTGGANACIKVRLQNRSGDSMFSNVACGGTGSAGAGPCGVGLGNGVFVTDVAMTNFNFYPTSSDEFRVAWYVCNSCTTKSAAVNVELDQYVNTTLDERTQFPISAGIPAGACVLQNTDPITTFQTSYWRADVLINGVSVGGTGMMFR